MAPGFLSKFVKPPSGSRHSSDRASARDGVSRSGSPSPKSSSSPPRSLSISPNLNPPPPLRVTQAPPSPSNTSLSSEPSVTVIPPSPRSYTSSFPSDRDSVKEEKGRESHNRPPSLVTLDHSSL